MHSEKGVSLVITFLLMTIMLTIVLSISTVLTNEIKIISNMGNSVPSFYAAETGAEKTLYYDNKQIPPGGIRGLCSLCGTCTGTDCTNCITTPLATGGCNTSTCNNCQVTYTSTIDNKTYSVTARVVPDGSNPSITNFTLDVRGFYANTTRAIQFNSTR